MGAMDDLIERRSVSRLDIGNESVVIDCGNDREQVTCCIWNVSPNGACLLISPDLLLPKRFYVCFDDGRRPATQIWRREHHVGVKFIDE